MKNEYELKLRINDEMLRKFLLVSKAEGRTPNNQFLFMLRNNVAYYEKTKGKILPAALKNIDISEYESEKNNSK